MKSETKENIIYLFGLVGIIALLSLVVYLTFKSNYQQVTVVGFQSDPRFYSYILVKDQKGVLYTVMGKLPEIQKGDVITLDIDGAYVSEVGTWP